MGNSNIREGDGLLSKHKVRYESIDVQPTIFTRIGAEVVICMEKIGRILENTEGFRVLSNIEPKGMKRRSVLL